MPGVDYKKYRPVSAISFRGSLLIGIIRLCYRLREWLGRPMPDAVVSAHHEDPLTMRFAEKTYMGQKYYYRAMVQPEPGSNLKEHFARQRFVFDVSAEFVPETSATLSMGGDLIPYTCIRKNSCEHLWDETGDFFFDADWVVANLESPADFSKPFSAAPEVMLHDMFFNVDAEAFQIFNGNGKYRGFDLLGVANNHSLDRGVEGLSNTLRQLKELGITPCGAVLNPDEQMKPMILERNGIRLAFIAATFSFNKETLPEGEEWRCNRLPLNHAGADMQLLIDQTRAARDAGADMVVALLHMGCAYQAYPSGHSVSNIRSLCDKAGVDIVIAGHPHHPQPMELYASPETGRKHFIVYSLGDFIARDIFKWGRLCLMPKFTLVKGKLNGLPHTCIASVRMKVGYMHAEGSGGKIALLKLLDYEKLRSEPGRYLKTNRDRIEFSEISTFFETFVLSPQQQADLGMG